MTIDIVDALRTLAPNCPDGEHTLLEAAEIIVQLDAKLNAPAPTSEWTEGDGQRIRPADPSI